jgi:hypothetical protein
VALLRFRTLLGCAVLAISSIAESQPVEPAAFFRSLPVNQVTESEGSIYVRAQDQRRGAMQALERILINRATVLAGHWLCRYTPKANQRLDTNLRGLNLVYSQESEGVMDVVIKLKKQQPECVVQAVVTRSEPLAATVPATSNTTAALNPIESVQAPMTQKAPIPQATAESSKAGFKVRVYSTEH